MAEDEELKLRPYAPWAKQGATREESAPDGVLGVSAAGRARAAGCGTTPPSASNALAAEVFP